MTEGYVSASRIRHILLTQRILPMKKHLTKQIANLVTVGILACLVEGVATASIDDEAGGSVDFMVEIDGVIAGASPVVHKGKVWNFDIKIPAGAKRIRLLVNDGGDGRGSDHADWVNVGFIK